MESHAESWRVSGYEKPNWKPGVARENSNTNPDRSSIFGAMGFKNWPIWEKQRWIKNTELKHRRHQNRADPPPKKPPRRGCRCRWIWRTWWYFCTKIPSTGRPTFGTRAWSAFGTTTRPRPPNRTLRGVVPWVLGSRDSFALWKSPGLGGGSTPPPSSFSAF